MSKSKKVVIALVGDHGLELDRKEIKVRSEQAESDVICNAVISAIEDWSLGPGDTIKIVEVQ